MDELLSSLVESVVRFGNFDNAAETRVGIERAIVMVAPTRRPRLLLLSAVNAAPNMFSVERNDLPPRAQSLLRNLHSEGFSVPLPRCEVCWRSAKIVWTAPDGRKTCRTCRARLTTEQCASCLCVRQVAKRVRGEAICAGCSRRSRAVPLTMCDKCGVPSSIIFKSDGQRLCGNCNPGRKATCVSCGESSRVIANIFEGPHCATCYGAISRTLRTCKRCGQPRILLNQARDGSAISSTCAGVPTRRACLRCGSEDNYNGRRCFSCKLDDLLSALVPKETSGSAQNLRTALKNASDPENVIRWITTRSMAQLLQEALRGFIELSHHHLDSLPPGKGVEMFRGHMVSAGILPERDEKLFMYSRWADRYLSTLPELYAVHLRAFNRWDIENRLRRRSRTNRTEDNAVARARYLLRSLRDFLDYATAGGLEVSSISQSAVDQYLSLRPKSAPGLQRFLNWAQTGGICAQITISCPTIAASPTPAMTDDEMVSWAHRFLNERDVDDRLRISALLTLFYAHPYTRTVQLKLDDFRATNLGWEAKLGADWVQLPVGLAKIAARLYDHASQAANPGLWLLPGGTPGSHLGALYISRLLSLLGFSGKSARTAAMLNLAGSMPPKVVADLVGVSISSATKWAENASRGWVEYPKLRGQ